MAMGRGTRCGIGSARRRLRLTYIDQLELRIAPAGNILVSTQDNSGPVVQEYSPSGVKLRTLPITFGGTDRDLAVSDDGNIHDYQGDIGAWLSSYNAVSQTWAVHAFAGWSTVNNISYGGIAYFNGAVYATDMLTSGDSSTQQGIVRFALSDFSAQRFATNISPIDLNIGLDGNLYALDASRTIYVFDPATMTQLRTVTLPSLINGASQDYRSVAVDASGNLYVATWGSQVFKFDSAGNYQTGLTLSGLGYTTFGLQDIDVASDGTLIVGAWGGTVFETTTALSGLTTAFSIGNTDTVFVTFAGAAQSPPPPPPSITISDAAIVEGNSGTNSMTFQVTLSNLYLSNVTVDYSTADGSASVAGSDYTATSGTLTFTPGQTTKFITVPIVGDTNFEHNETFAVNLSNPTNSSIARGTGKGTIADDDPAPITQSLLASAANILRDYTGSGTFTEEVSGTSTLSVRKFNFNPGSGIPYDERSVMEFDVSSIVPNDLSGGALQVKCVSTTTPQTTNVYVYGYADDGNITLADGSAPGVLLGTFVPTSLTTYTIQLDLAGLLSIIQPGTNHIALRLQGIPNDNVQFAGTSVTGAPKLLLAVKPPEISVSDLSVNEGDTAVFNVTLSKALTTPVNFSYTTTASQNAPFAIPNQNYVPVQGTATFAPGQTSLTISVDTFGNPGDDSGKMFSLLAYNATSPTAYVHAQGTATIVDNPNARPGILTSNISLTEGNGGTTPATFTVTLSVPSQNTVTVDYATADMTAMSPADYQSTSGTLIFAPGQTSKTVTVQVVGDNSYESNEAFSLNFSNATNAVIVNKAPSATIIDDDPQPSLAIGNVSVVKPTSGQINAVFTVTLSAPSGFYTSVNWATANGTALAGEHYQSYSGSLTFNPGVVSQTISIPVFGNTFTEGNKTFTVTLSSSSNATIGTATGTATIVDQNPTSGTMSFVANSWGFAEDHDGNGTFDTLSLGAYDTPVYAFNNVQDRSLFEFDVSRVVTGVVNSVVFTFYIDSYVSNGGGVNIGGFASGGTLALSDATRSISPLGSYQPNDLGLGVTSITLDRAAVLAIVGNSNFLGIRLDPAASYVNTGIFSPIAGPANAPFMTFHADLPVAFNDSYTTSENVGLTIPAGSGVLTNDYRVSGTTLTAVIKQTPSHGNVTLNSDGSFTYTPTQYYNGTDQFTYQASDGTNTSAPATVSITVTPVNQQPNATPQTVTLPDSGATAITLHGTDVETPASALVYKLTTLPASGTLLRPDGTPAIIGDTFTGAGAVLTYLLPTEVIGALSTSFNFTVTDNGDPAGSQSNPLTSTSATVTIQTPSASNGVLRIGGSTGDDTFALANSSDGTALHVVMNGSTVGSDIPFSSITRVAVGGHGGNDTFTVGAGIGVPVAVYGSLGNDTLSASPINLTFDGGGGADSATLGTSSGGVDIATLSPNSGQLNGPGYVISLANVATITINANANDSATFSDSPGNDAFTATPTFAILSGPGYSNRINGASSVKANSTAGGSDSANLSDTSGSNTLYQSPTGSSFIGTGFYNKVLGFKSVTATAASGTNDIAYLSDISGNNSFTATPTSATFTGSGFTNTANGFKKVYATAAAGTTDTANLSDSSGSNTFTAKPTVSTFSGSGFFNQVNGFASVTATAASGTNDSASLYDVSGNNSFTATPSSATFSGSGFSETANGFKSVYGYAASGTNDSASLSDSSGSNTLYESPTGSSFIGTGFFNKVLGFKSVTATAASGTSDIAYLSDISGNNAFTATPTSATFTGSGFTNTANGFKKVYATAAAGTTDTASLSDTSGSNTFTAKPTVSSFSGASFFNQVSGFASVTATAASGTNDTASLYDASGSNTFTASPTSATFSGSGFSETANGFKSVYGYAASGTNDSASLSDTSGSNTLYETPTGTSFIGTGFYNKVLGFKSVTATAASGTNDIAYLSDTSGSNTFTATPTSATFTGSGFTNTANAFKKVYATAASTTDVASLFDDALGALFTGTGKVGTLAGPSYTVTVAQYGTVNITGATGAQNKIHLDTIDYALNEYGNWTSV